MDSGQNNNSSYGANFGSYEKALQRAARENFMISCGIGLVIALGCWYFGFIASTALFFSQFPVLASMPSPLLQLVVGIGFGIAGRYMVEYVARGFIYGIGLINKGLNRVNKSLMKPSASYFAKDKKLKGKVGMYKTCAILEFDKGKELYNELEKLEAQALHKFDEKGKELADPNVVTKDVIYRWEIAKFKGIENNTSDYKTFYEEVKAANKQPHSLKAALGL